MKRFTVKDFILYNGPCWSCGQPISFNIGYADSDHEKKHYETPLLPTHFFPDHIEVDLQVKYSSALKLSIDFKTNKFASNSEPRLEKYLKLFRLYPFSNCQKCKSYVMGNFLEIDLKKGFIKPISILREVINLYDIKTDYQIHSDESSKMSYIYIQSKDRTHSPIIIDSPLISRSRFKTKEQLIKKLRNYIIFS